MSDIHEFKAVRRPDGSIDGDFYRARAMAARRAALRDSAALRQAFRTAAAALGVVGLVALLAPQVGGGAFAVATSTQHCAAQRPGGAPSALCVARDAEPAGVFAQQVKQARIPAGRI